MTAPRILLINPDGTAEVNGVKVRVVPEEPTREIIVAGYFVEPSENRLLWRQMLSAADIDLSGLPKVPSTHGFGSKGEKYDAGYKDGFAAALDAMGVK